MQNIRRRSSMAITARITLGVFPHLLLWQFSRCTAGVLCALSRVSVTVTVQQVHCRCIMCTVTCICYFDSSAGALQVYYVHCHVYLLLWKFSRCTPGVLCALSRVSVIVTVQQVHCRCIMCTVTCICYCDSSASALQVYYVHCHVYLLSWKFQVPGWPLKY